MADQKLLKGTEVWVKSDCHRLWEVGKVLASGGKSGQKVFVRTKSGDARSVAYLTNPSVEGDMTALWHIHEPGILYNLEQRSWSNAPYTLMGPVLVAVNPLQRVSDPEGILGTSKASLFPHPYAIAETSFQQLKFAAARLKQQKGDEELDQLVNQSIVVGGESGAGKTESSKMVLRHLVERCGGGGIDKKLLSSNPILEAFGNATTSRNPNSSRFGKFMKLHFDDKVKQIKTASIETYLLERSRITAHEVGERGYHVFYQLLAGSSKDKRANLGLTGSFTYLTPGNTKELNRTSKRRSSSNDTNEEFPCGSTEEDKKNFKALCKAFDEVGFSKEDVKRIFKVIAGVLHLGNIHFDDKTQREGEVATYKEGKRDPANWAHGMLGIPKKELVQLFTTREVKAGGETMTTYRNSIGASLSRDAVVKSLYSKLFDHILAKINKSFGKTKNVNDLHFIGVLDIFGFESFERNDFEQLLINFTNEALQSTFNKQVFESEAELYKRENLAIASTDQIEAPPNNKEGMDLLNSLLAAIDSEGKLPQASDLKMNEKFHRAYTGKNKCFLKVHPKDRAEVFRVLHYAGEVNYTVGSFLLKNNDKLPNEVDLLFRSSVEPLVQDIFGGEIGANKTKAVVSSLTSRIGNKNGSIVAKFKNQISKLVETLDSTRCSFIRCVKPNAFMRRVKGDKGWFDRGYVTMQLKCLSIPQTAEVLKTGFPTRISYESLVTTYKKIIPSEALRSWKKLGNKSETGFVGALFWAFEIDRKDYKLGRTKVFFQSGMLAKLDKVLSSADDWAKKDGDQKAKKKFVKKFRKYHAWRKWRICLAIVQSASAFNSVYKRIKVSSNAAQRIQSAYRAYVDRARYRGLKKAALQTQSMWRGIKTREKTKKKMKKLQAKQKESDKNLERKKSETDNRTKLLREEEQMLKEDLKNLKEKLEKTKDKAKRKTIEAKIQKVRKKQDKNATKLSKFAKQSTDKAIELNVRQVQRRRESESYEMRKARKNREHEAKQDRVSKLVKKQVSERRESMRLKNEKKIKARARSRKSLRALSERQKNESDLIERGEYERRINATPLKASVEVLTKGNFGKKWKRFTYILDRQKREITVFKPKSKKEYCTIYIFSSAHEKKPKVIVRSEYKKRENVLEVRGVHRGDNEFDTTYLAFSSQKDMESWSAAIRETIDGYDVREMGGKLYTHRQRSGTNLQTGERSFESKMRISAEALEELGKLEIMLDRNEITEESYNLLLRTIDLMPDKQHLEDSEKVVCSQCDCTRNNRFSPTCVNCGGPLHIQKIHESSAYEPEKPEGREPLSTLKVGGGKIYFYFDGHEAVYDFYHVLRRHYKITCHWEKSGQVNEQWTIRYRYSGFRTLRKLLKSLDDEDIIYTDNNGEPTDLPKLPKRRRALVKNDDGEASHQIMGLPAADRSKYLHAFLCYIFNMPIALRKDRDGSSELFSIDRVEEFFEIREHVYNEQQIEISPSNVVDLRPLDSSEIENLRPLLRIMLGMLQKTLKPDDDSLEAMYASCMVHYGRLKLCADRSNKYFVIELAESAEEVIELMERVMRMYAELRGIEDPTIPPPPSHSDNSGSEESSSPKNNRSRSPKRSSPRNRSPKHGRSKSRSKSKSRDKKKSKSSESKGKSRKSGKKKKSK